MESQLRVPHLRMQTTKDAQVRRVLCGLILHAHHTDLPPCTCLQAALQATLPVLQFEVSWDARQEFLLAEQGCLISLSAAHNGH